MNLWQLFPFQKPPWSFRGLLAAPSQADARYTLLLSPWSLSALKSMRDDSLHRLSPLIASLWFLFVLHCFHHSCSPIWFISDYEISNHRALTPGLMRTVTVGFFPHLTQNPEWNSEGDISMLSFSKTKVTQKGLVPSTSPPVSILILWDSLRRKVRIMVGLSGDLPMPVRF